MSANKDMILKIVLRVDSHPTAEDIYGIIRKHGRKISMATVYNNLNSLAEEGLIRRVSFDGKSEHYDKAVRHDHLVCSECGKITDLMLEDMTGALERDSGVKLESYDLKLFYICDECRKKAMCDEAEDQA